ncbi:MAG: beta-N-acetylhexosaminidase [Clostridia bacterium]|nr:beta-N-acetylhexosaminidase [Clostridia bacterium]
MANYKYERFGVMIDMSRNAVMNITALKNYISILKKMGYNCVMLYTEDTYEVEGEPFFGYLRGRYTEAEMKEIDDYAYSIGVEVIPCIQTLAHLNAYIRWKKTPIDCNDILLVDDDRTYNLIERMFKTLSRCFRSKLIHLGMDEAHMLGRGAHLDIHGYEKSGVLMNRHLDKVREIAAKYGYQPMIWSDMFFRSWNRGAYNIPKSEIPEYIKNDYPKEVIPVYWNYYSKDQETYDNMFDNHKQLSSNIWFAGGAWSWSGIIPHNKFSLETMFPAMRSCRKNKINNVIITLWGDDGGECSHFSQLPALYHIIEYAKGNEDEAKVKAKFERMFKIPYDSFMKMDIPNSLTGANWSENPSKYMLYSDLFLGFLDSTVSEGVGEKYGAAAKELYDIAKTSRTYGYLFKTAAALCEVLELKYEIGVKTRAAYRNGNKEELKAIADTYLEISRRIRKLHSAFSYQWHKENKPHGFDVQDIRLLGVAGRIESLRKRLLDYVNGKIDVIDELEEEILSYGKTDGVPVRCNEFKNYISPNVATHG